MARRENTFKRYLVQTVGTRWDVQSHEDIYSEGIPDLSFGAKYKNGWIELKQIEAWPKRIETPAKPKKYTPEQVNWLIRRGKKSGNCFVFVKVGKDEYFLFNWYTARQIRKGMTREEYHFNCVKRWYSSINPDELVDILTT